MKYPFGALCALLVLAGCGSHAKKSDSDFERDLVTQLQHNLLIEIQGLNQGARDLQADAPLPANRGWDETADEAAITAMKNDWMRLRVSWERAEGVLAALFPTLDFSMDARYEDFLDQLGPSGDADLFDGTGVTGMHGLERILFRLDTPASVVAREAALVGYQAAAWPATADEAAEFKTGLCAKLVSDSQLLADSWAPEAINLPAAFDGLTGLMNEQAEKVSLAGLQREESRYAQRTMRDIRDNLAGTRAFYALFTPWLVTKPGGPGIDLSVQNALDRLALTYSTVPGEAIPQAPASWNPQRPSIADQSTDFGKLYMAVTEEVAPNRPGSAVDEMNRAAQALSLPEFTGAE